MALLLACAIPTAWQQAARATSAVGRDASSALMIAYPDRDKKFMLLHGSGQTAHSFVNMPTARSAKDFLAGMPLPNRFRDNWEFTTMDADTASGEWCEDGTAFDASIAKVEAAVEEQQVAGLVGFEQGGTLAAIVERCTDKGYIARR